MLKKHYSGKTEPSSSGTIAMQCILSNKLVSKYVSALKNDQMKSTRNYSITILKRKKARLGKSTTSGKLDHTSSIHSKYAQAQACTF